MLVRHLTEHGYRDYYIKPVTKFQVNMYKGSSTEPVAFQVYEILKTDHEFLQFF